MKMSPISNSYFDNGGYAHQVKFARWMDRKIAEAKQAADDAKQAADDAKILNVSTRKIGGLRFIKIGRFCVSFCVTQNYRSL